MINKEKCLNHLINQEERIAMSYLLDLVELVTKKHIPLVTSFYDPYYIELAISILKGIKIIKYKLDGSYDLAERKRIIIYPDYFKDEDIISFNIILKLTGNSFFTKLTHRDFLGATLGLGLKREKIGDIIVGDSATYIIVASELADYIKFNMTHIGKVKVCIEESFQQELLINIKNNYQIINCTVSSLRIDSIASNGFNISRNKMLKLIKNNNIKCNFKEISNPDYIVKTGDVISCRGKGIIIIEEVKGTNKKGRERIGLKKFK